MTINIEITILDLLFPLCIGVILGGSFFYTLWLTVNKGLKSSHPAFWFLGSVLARMSVAITVFYWVSDDNLFRLLMCLIGFIIGRVVMTKTLSKNKDNKVNQKELPYAS